MTTQAHPSTARRLAGALLISLGAFGVPAHADNSLFAIDTSFSFDSEPGAVGGGQSRVYKEPDAKFVLTGGSSNLTMNVTTKAGDDWTIQMASFPGVRLHPGTYPLAERASFRIGRVPGLDVYGYGFGACNQVWGSFIVDQVQFDESNNVTMLDANFVQRCYENGPAMRGVVHYKAPPRSFSFTSDPGDRLANGRSASFTGAASFLRLSGKPNWVQYNVSGNRETWMAIISPPTGQTLQPGTYATSDSPTQTLAGLSITGNGTGCSSSTGSLTISSITVGKDGDVASLGANFEYHCDSNQPAFRGAIRHRNN